MAERQDLTQLSDEELMALTGGQSFVSTDALIDPGCTCPITKYGVTPFYGVQVLYGIAPEYGIQPLYGIIPVDKP